MELKKIKLETLGVREHGVPIDDNLIDKDLDSMFYPLHLMQMALLSPKYILKKNLAKPNNILFKLLSIGLTAMLCFVFTYRIHNLSINEELLLNIPTMYYSAYFDLVFYSIGFVIIIVENVFKSNNNIRFLLKIQDLHRAFNNETSSKRFLIWNWIYVIVNIFLSFFASICICYLLEVPFYMYFCCVSLILIDATMVYATRMIALLADKVNLWTNKVQSVIFYRLDFANNEDACKFMFKAYKLILVTYDMFKSSFQRMILFNIIHFFWHILIYVEISVECLEYVSSHPSYMQADLDFDATTTFVILFNYTTWIYKMLMTQVLLSTNFEAFYRAVDKSQDVCAIILNSNCTDAEKRLCKNVKRLHEVEFEKMDVCRVVCIDANLPLKLIELTTNYTIALLQFALL